MVYLSLFFAVFIEGPLATTAAAALAALDPNVHLGLVSATAMVGNLCADLFWYLLGRFGAESLPVVFRNRLAGLEEQASRSRKHIRAQGLRYFAGAKLGFGVATIPVLLAVGAGGIPLRRLLPVALICELIWTSGMVGIGYLGLARIPQTLGSLDPAVCGWGGTGLILTMLLLWGCWRKNRGLEE